MKYKKILFNLIIIITGVTILKKKIFLAGNKIPKITIFLPVYNREDYLERSISSVQNQTLKNIEIIAINDGCTDNSLKILKKLKKKDKRIKIFNNDRNRGPLYTRAMGISNSTGDYLMNLDSDDKLVNNDCLKKLYKFAKFYKTDILQFLIKRVPLFQNQTKYFDFLNKNQLNSPDFVITNKLVKRELYMNAFKILESRIIGPKWVIHDDNIWNSLLKKYAKSKSVVEEYIYYYKRNIDSLNFKMGSLLDIKSKIYRMESYQKFIDKNDIISFDIYLSSVKKFLDNHYLGYIFEETRNKLKHIIINFINSNYIYLHNNYIKELNYNINELTNKKYIILYDEKDILSFNSTYVKIIKYLHNQKKKYLFVNDKSSLKIVNYIYPNDILVGFIDCFCKKDIKMLISLFRKNKYIALLKNKEEKYNYTEFENNPYFDFKENNDNLFNNFIL